MPSNAFNINVVDHLQQIIDYASSTVNYVGLASPSASVASAVWQIKRLTLDSSGRTTNVEFAGLSANFDQIWNSRADLTYRPAGN